MTEYASAPQARDLAIAGQNIHFWRGGAGPCLLLLHAAWGDAELSWNSVWGALCRSFTVIAPDLPGFGRSSALSPPTLSGMANLLKRLLDELKVESAVTVGNSFGAAVASQLAGTFPQTVSCLVLVNGGYMPAVPGPVRTLIALPGLKQFLGLLMRRHTFSLRALNGAFVVPAGLPSGFFDRILTNSRAYSRIGFESWLNMTGPMPRPAVPALILWGNRDGLGPMKYARFLKDWIPGARLVEVEGAGHMPQVERPENFIATIRSLAHSHREGSHEHA